MSASAPLAPNGLVAPSAAAGGLRLLRPLRGARRRDLRALCVSRGVEWEEDPTNQDMRYLRNRIRRVLERSAPGGRYELRGRRWPAERCRRHCAWYPGGGSPRAPGPSPTYWGGWPGAGWPGRS
mmetsp:Transcript_18054/g.58440  ORF Transcript_18054/g.58440 Transcript_18054/m.58440 type:complete len:124 (+) Transcript_18054:264-635(+)